MTTTKRPMFGLFYFDLTKNNRTRPASMLIRPATRSSRSDIRASCSNTRRVAWGFRNGSSPSSTSRMDTAASRSVQAKCTPVNPLAPARRIQVLEELAFGRYDPDIAIARQRAAIRLQAAVEGIELRRLAVGLRVDARSQAIPLAAQALGITRRIGKDFRDLAVGLGADAFAVGAALGAQLVAAGAEALLHALVHRAADFIRQVDALHAHVDQFHTQLVHRSTRPAEHVAGEYRALGDDDFLQRAARDHALDAVLDVLAQQLGGEVRIAVGGAVVLRGVADPPLDVEVDDQRLVLAGEEGLAFIALGHDAPLEAPDIVDPQRPLQVQPRLVVGADDLAELHADRHFGFP